ncbi:hypothetical protein [Pseudonocardia sp. N23]|uniref:hypothetical protein n=1 Tax=Pseudonocardia sp. N23 TaxID=1987376 RepID=UPI000BFC7303|nr:hypothetical protein [Pseudonocardia sp. N23]GAY09960.1 amino acid permease [Pseudonocardia sp. N23]
MITSAGEIVAWIIGWDLILELAVGSAVVSTSWSKYLHETLAQLGLEVPTQFSLGGAFTFDWGALLLVVVLTALLALGRVRTEQESTPAGD